jgi:transposase InsO family protein
LNRPGILKERKIDISMDGRGRALDNIFVGRLWRSVKYEDAYIRDDEWIKPGDKVIVKGGALNNFAWVFGRGLKDTDRIRILLETVSYQAHLEIVREMVKKVRQICWR